MSIMPGRVIADIADDLAQLGVESGDALILHSSFRSLGRKDIAPIDVIRTLIEVLGDAGTLMVPTFTYSFSGIWNVHPFNRQTTPGFNLGILTETLRLYPGALRSGHPTYSVAAYGRYAREITEGKDAPGTSSLGKGSSYDEAIGRGAKVLLLGVGSNRNSSVHHAEAVAELPTNHIPFRAFWGKTALIEGNGEVIEVPLKEEFPSCSANFGVADDYLIGKGILRRGSISQAECMLMGASDMVRVVAERLRREPDWLFCSSVSCEPCALRRRFLHKRGLTR